MRTKQLIIRVSMKEHEELLKRAGAMRLATYIRTAAADGIPPRIPEINREALEELRRIGVNINQLARLSNSRGQIENIDQLKKTIAELRLALIEVKK